MNGELSERVQRHLGSQKHQPAGVQIVSYLPPSPLGLEIDLLLSLCATIGTPRALTVSLLAKNGEWDQLVGLKPYYASCASPEHFAQDYLVTSLVRKSQNLPLAVDRRKEALHRFYSGEESCRRVNERYMNENPPEPSWLRKTRNIISSVLGPLKSSDVRESQARKSGFPLDRIIALAKHGPGAAVGLKGTGSVVSDKYDTIPTCTPRLARYAESIMGPNWWDANSNRGIKIVPGSNWTNVPKSASTDRGIAIEPLLNVYLQLGIGEYLVSRLKRFGCDLSDQSWNQTLAGLSRRWDLATLDLSNASDTLAWSVVLSLLPPEWFELLYLARSDFSKVDGHWVELEKFSSMGNGYTFPLETLVFLAVVYSFVPKEEQCLTGVYGDDIIVPRRYAAEIIQALEFLGFSVNPSKSFLGGNFFESCGHDYFMDKLVTPFYARMEQGDPVPYPLHLANELRLWTSRLNASKGLSGCSSLYQGVWQRLIKHVPAPWNRCFGPPQYGDSVIICSDIEGAFLYMNDRKVNSMYLDRVGDGWEGFALRHCVIQLDSLVKGTPGVLLAALSTAPTSTDGYFCHRRGDEHLFSSGLGFTRGREIRRNMFDGVKTRVGWSRDWPEQAWV